MHPSGSISDESIPVPKPPQPVTSVEPDAEEDEETENEEDTEEDVEEFDDDITALVSLFGGSVQPPAPEELLMGPTVVITTGEVTTGEAPAPTQVRWRDECACMFV